MFKNLFDKFRNDTLSTFTAPYLLDQEGRNPVCFSRGLGARLWDHSGQAYLDASGGAGAVFLGHSHHRVSEVISLQADKLLHAGQDFLLQEQAALAQALCKITQMERVFFAHTPQMAMQRMLSLLVIFAKQNGVKNPVVLSPSESLKLGVNNTLQHQSIKFSDIDALGQRAANENVIAVFMPSMHCANGFEFCDLGYLNSVRSLCDEHGWLLICDETLTSPARTGSWFAYQHENIQPDAFFGSLAMANGIPLGVGVLGPALSELSLAATEELRFAGSPLACQVAISVLDEIESQQLMPSANKVGDNLKRKIQHQIGTLMGVKDIRGRGLFLIIELEQAHPDLQLQFLLRGLLVEVLDNGRVIRLTPPVSLDEKEAAQVAQVLYDVLSQA